MNWENCDCKSCNPELPLPPSVEEPKPKPRMGDYYAGLSGDAWFALAMNVEWDCVGVVNVAERLFVHLEEVSGLLDTRQVAVASDAFAFGALKYGIGCWRDVSSDDHMQGAGRHFETWLKDPQSKDEESGLLHEAHFLARAIMCLEQRRVGK